MEKLNKDLLNFILLLFPPKKIGDIILNKKIWKVSNSKYFKLSYLKLYYQEISSGLNFAVKNENAPYIEKWYLFIKDWDPSVENNILIRWASENGNEKLVSLLLKDDRVNPSVFDNYPIRIAAENGHLSIVKKLLKDNRVNPGDSNNIALRKAATKGYYDIVEVLLENNNVSIKNITKKDIHRIQKRKYTKIFDLLIYKIQNDKKYKKEKTILNYYQ
jgi:hypothetical protein